MYGNTNFMSKASINMEIRSTKLNISISETVYLIKKCEISIPNNLDCTDDWDIGQKKAYIESLILGFPSPSFIFTKNEEQILVIVDGVKRLKAIIDYINNEFSIQPKIDGYEVNIDQRRNFNELNKLEQNRLLRVALLFSVHEFENQEDAKIFSKRLHSDYEILSKKVKIIDRFIEFNNENYSDGLLLISNFNGYLIERYPEKKISVKIQQDGLKLRMIVETEEGDIEEIEQVLSDYGKYMIRKQNENINNNNAFTVTEDSLNKIISALSDKKENNINISINNDGSISNEVKINIESKILLTERLV
jgi:hypothetical protein